MPPRLILLGLMLVEGCAPKVGGRCAFGQATCTGDRAALFCGPHGTFEALVCRGRDGCQQEGAGVSCDQSIAIAGDTCLQHGFACTSDARTDLVCRDGAFTLAEPCPGHFGCRLAPYDGFAPGGSGNVLCDHDVAQAGEPCLDEGEYACTSDAIGALVCEDKRMVAVGECRGARGCRVAHRGARGRELACDTSTDEGEL